LIFWTNILKNQMDKETWGNCKRFLLKKLSNWFQRTDKPVSDKNGNPFTTKEQLKRWVEHFRELLNRLTPKTPSEIHTTNQHRPPNHLQQVNKDKNLESDYRKSVGSNEIPAEAIKADFRAQPLQQDLEGKV
jgi:hypothetical protein